MENKHNKLYYLYWNTKLRIWSLLNKDEQTTDESLRLAIKFDIINEDLSPKHCFECGHDKFKECNHIHLTESVIGEYDAKCKNCGRTNGYWAYGYWQP